jgi:hypothetical protein
MMRRRDRALPRPEADQQLVDEQDDVAAGPISFSTPSGSSKSR